MNFLQRCKELIKPPSALVIAAKNLDEHERLLLEARKDLCWADKRVKFHLEQIEQLTIYLKERQ